MESVKLNIILIFLLVINHIIEQLVWKMAVVF